MICHKLSMNALLASKLSKFHKLAEMDVFCVNHNCFMNIEFYEDKIEEQVD